MVANRRTLLLVARVGCLALLAGSLHAAQPHRPKPPMEIPVVVVKYFPVKGDRIDIGVTGDWGAPLKQTREKTDKLTAEVAKALQEGSRYHAYKNPRAKPSLVYRILRTIEYLEPLPTVPRPGRKVPNTDYNKIMERIGIRRWVEQKGVKQVWIWGYHGGVVNLWESNMAGPWGDISNSSRDPNDLPVLKKTYTVYHYNYQRGPSEAVEDHMHQIETVLNHVDGRDRTAANKWHELLFWGKFVGSDRTHKIVRPGCGRARLPFHAYQQVLLGCDEDSPAHRDRRRLPLADLGSPEDVCAFFAVPRSGRAGLGKAPRTVAAPADRTPPSRNGREGQQDRARPSQQGRQRCPCMPHPDRPTTGW